MLSRDRIVFYSGCLVCVALGLNSVVRGQNSNLFGVHGLRGS